MRKYQQLLLLIISIVCVITLLFYRHEYLELRYALGVLNFFGSADSTDKCLILSPDFKADITDRYKFAEPRSAWTKLEDHYIYSSFWESRAEGGYIRSLVIGPKSTFFKFSCRVWFEEGDIIVSEQGTFTFDLDVNSKTKNVDEDTFKYFLKCAVSRTPERSVPYGVLWITPANSSNNVFSPVFHLKKTVNKTVICVQPDYAGISKTEIVEFITFYDAIGVTDFIIYDSGIQHSIFPFLESLVGRSGIIQSLTVLQWNFPVSDLRLEGLSLRDDCLSRTLGSARLIGITAWNEFIMPAKNNINDLISLNTNDLINVSFETWLCCSDYPDEKVKKELPLFLRKRHCIKRDTEEKLFINGKSYENVKRRIYELPSEIVVTRRYDLCGKLPPKSTSVLPVSELYTQLTSHRLLRLWKSHLNASSIFS